MFNRLVNRLPDNYQKSKDSINGKLYEIYARELQEVKQVLDDIKKQQDVDNATHKTLDLVGKNVLEYRNTEDDDLYRQFIKTKIIANLSKGDIVTLNTVAGFLLKDNFLGFNETWKDEGYDDIAGLVGKIKLKLGEIPIILDGVRAGGVKLYWEATAVDNLIKIKSNAWKGKSLYPLCNTIDAGTWHYQQNFGRVKNVTLKTETDKRLSRFDYPETALISASGSIYQRHEFAEQLTLEQLVILNTVMDAVNLDYVKANEVLTGEYPDLMNNIKSILREIDLKDKATVGKVIYPVCNDTILGGGN